MRRSKRGRAATQSSADEVIRTTEPTKKSARMTSADPGSDGETSLSLYESDQAMYHRKLRIYERHEKSMAYITNWIFSHLRVGKNVIYFGERPDRLRDGLVKMRQFTDAFMANRQDEKREEIIKHLSKI